MGLDAGIVISASLAKVMKVFPQRLINLEVKEKPQSNIPTFHHSFLEIAAKLIKGYKFSKL
jgi:hypothetical protein